MTKLIITEGDIIGLQYENGKNYFGKFHMGCRVRKKPREGAGEWQGHIVGAYMTVTGIGYAVRSEREKNSVQIYPESVLELVE